MKNKIKSSLLSTAVLLVAFSVSSLAQTQPLTSKQETKSAPVTTVTAKQTTHPTTSVKPVEKKKNPEGVKTSSEKKTSTTITAKSGENGKTTAVTKKEIPAPKK